MAKESTSGCDMCVDDTYFSALLFNEHEDEGKDEDHHDQILALAVSDVKYAEELQFQEAIMASLISSRSSNNTQSPPAILPTPTPLALPEPGAITVADAGESSHSFCEICVEKKESDEMFRVHTCSHSFCSACISKHVAVKLQDNLTAVACPGLDCGGVLEIDTCRPMIPKEVIQRWDEALIESLILASQKFYCPFKDCSAMLVNDGAEVVRESECPECRRLFCAQCYVAWHSGVECEELQRLNVDERGKEDLMVRELAKEKNWMRCPHCKFYVEKTEGCLHMTCRCGFQYCYACGETWSSSHGGCQTQT